MNMQSYYLYQLKYAVHILKKTGPSAQKGPFAVKNNGDVSV